MRRNLFTLGFALLLLLIVPSLTLAATVHITEDAASEPADFSANPGTLAQFINAFGTSKNGSGTTTFDSLTVTTTGTANIAKVEIRSSDGSVILGSTTTSAGDAWTITPLNPNPGGNGGLYRVYVDVAAGATPTQTVTAYISGFVETTGATAGTATDTAGTIMTITSGGSCTPSAPTLALGAGVTLDASASNQYTITVTNNDAGAGCTDRAFDIVWQSDNMTPADGSFTTPTTLSGTCNFSLAAGASDTGCKLDVASTAGAVDGTTLQTTVVDNTSSVTGNVTTSISLGGVGCSQCHDYPPTDGTRALATGYVLGSHAVHADQASWLVPTYLADCTVCHTDTTTGETDMAHRSGDIQMAATIQGGSYSKGTTFAQNKNPTLGTCGSTNCHGPNDVTGPTWGGGAMTCTSCHNDGGGNPYPTSGSQFRSAAAAGAHATHLTGTAALMDGGVVCIDCHTSYTNASDGGHFDTAAPANVPFPAAGDADLNATTPSYGGGTCSVYCHAANLPGTTGATNNNISPIWATDTSTGCSFCHGYPPNGSHSTSTDCSTCHDHVDAATDDGFTGATNIAKHINGVIDSSGCTGCHGTDPNEYPPTAAWGTNKSTANGVGAHVTHMENTHGVFLTKEDVDGNATPGEYNDWCGECHTNSRGTGGHNDGYPAEISFADAVEANYNGTTPSFTAEGDADPDTGVGGSCTVYCHGANMPNGDTGGSNRTPSWGDTISDCGACHAAPPANHGAVALTNCGDCHTTTMTSGLTTITNASNHINGSIQVDTSDCASCHNSGGFGAPLVGAATSHSTGRMDATIGGAAWTCQDCHVGHGAGTIEIANATWQGDGTTDIFNYTANGEGGISLGGPRAAGATEAEICWSCHFANGISEWGPNTNTNGGIADYDFGSVSGQPNEAWVSSNGGTGATWTSANTNFAYKTAAIQSTHGVNGGSQGLDSYATISCTYCHDVHDTGGGMSGKPYLRGSWVGSPYPEDGAPYLNANYPNAGTKDTFDAVPRGVSTGNISGGYWIDQNSGNPISGYTPEQFGGLCEKCHGNNDGTFSAAEIDSLNVYGTGTAEWVSNYNGHENAVKGASGIDGSDAGAEVTARNIFNARGGSSSYGNNPFMHFTGMTDPGWQGAAGPYGFRGTNNTGGSTWGYNPTHANTQVRLYNVNNWGADSASAPLSTDGSVTNDLYHQFSCSKCHNPHASRLPALMITNCLDTKHNAWDNNLQLNASGGSNNNNRAISNWTSAQNCHRLGGVMTDGTDPAFDSRSDAAGVGGGWNTVTPW